MNLAIRNDADLMPLGASGVTQYRISAQMGWNFDGLQIDSFCGGGGASLGMENGTGRIIDIAINHDPPAISQHICNHPQTKHYNESVWAVDPIKATNGQLVSRIWFSPDCRHFSKAASGRPVDRKIRGLAWIVLKWAALTKPQEIYVENVPQFLEWTILTRGHRPVKSKKGQTFNRWKSQLEALGYKIDYKVLKCSEYGVPTTRERLFLVARRDGFPIKFPDQTHGPKGSGLLPFLGAADYVIDWSLPCPSIFDRKKLHRPKTHQRLARGIRRFILESNNPYFAPSDSEVATNLGSREGFCATFIAKHYGGNYKGAGIDMRGPLNTITNKDHHSLVCCYLTKFRGTNIGTPIDDPVPTISAQGTHIGLVAVLLNKYLGSADGTNHLIRVNGELYQISDIGLRMLQPNELYKAHGFPEDYIFTHGADGTAFTKTQQVAKVGNSVPPRMAQLLIEANAIEREKSSLRAA